MTVDAAIQKETRGKGRGSSFSVLGRDIWQKLWSVKTSNRMNLVSAYLVLLTGTGADHRLTKWSAKACEDYVGMGKPRAKVAIEELIAAGLVKRSPNSTKLRPQYILSETPEGEEDPIFLPNQLITGLSSETPIVRRVRETGDSLLLRMLIDLYGLIQLDVTFGVPVSNLCQISSVPARKITEMGANALWAIDVETSLQVKGEWVRIHYVDASTEAESWRPFWERVNLLKKIGALVFETWVFDGTVGDSEPMFPVNLTVLYSPNYTPDDEAKLASLVGETASLLVGEQEYLFDRYGECFLLPIPLHHRAPAIVEVAKLRVEADTPGRRMTFAQRKKRMLQYAHAFQELKKALEEGAWNVPLKLSFDVEAA